MTQNFSILLFITLVYSLLRMTLCYWKTKRNLRNRRNRGKWRNVRKIKMTFKTKGTKFRTIGKERRGFGQTRGNGRDSI